MSEDKSRLGSETGKLINPVYKVSKLHMTVVPSMTAALQQSHRRVWKQEDDNDIRIRNAIGNRPLTGDPQRLKQAMVKAEVFAELAIEYDQRLACKSQWLRRDEGEHVCAALLAEGDDQPFYKRQRSVINEATAAGEPMRIVISTDDNHVPDDTAAAFIATVRLVQQFVPLEVWWQGAWLNANRDKGFVFLVPLINGDMDYSRLEFCINDNLRDNFSFSVMMSHAILDLKETNKDCGFTAANAYHPTDKYSDGSARPDFRHTTKFVSHHGINPNPESIANTAATWLGWQTLTTEEWQREAMAREAGQSIPAKPSEYKYQEPTAADRKRWKEDDDARMRAAKKAADQRIAMK
jgi:hypothetical protein